MQPMEAQRQHVLTIIESAQRAGRSENEIIDIVDRYFGRGQARVHGLSERGRIRRLIERRQRDFDRIEDPRRRRERAYALLARNGFDPEVCRTVAASVAPPAGRP